MFLDIIAVTNIGGRVNIVVRGVNITVVGGDKHRSAEKANKLLDFKWVLLNKKYMERKEKKSWWVIQNYFISLVSPDYIKRN